MASGTTGGGSGIARLVAVVAAGALIAGGLLVRNARSDDDDDPPPGTTAASTPPAAADVVCITELEAVCDALAADPDVDVSVSVAPAGETLDALAGRTDPAGAPLWVTIDPFPAMVDALRQQEGLDPIGYQVAPAAATQIGVVTAAGRGAFLVEECGSARVWRCLGDWAGTEWIDHGGDASWGRVRPSVGDAGETALGLASFATAVAGFSGSTSIGAVAELSADPEFINWLGGLTNTVPVADLTQPTPLATMLVLPSRIDAAAASDDEFSTLPHDRTAPYEIQYPDTTMWATAVLAAPASASAPNDLIDRIAPVLESAEWTDVSLATAPLPDASTMLALRQLWSDYS
jgi:hypothetical protein